MKSKEIWSKRSKKHVILISQTALTNPWIYRDPELIMILAAWLQLEVWWSKGPHILSAQASQDLDDLKKYSRYFSFHLSVFLTSWSRWTAHGSRLSHCCNCRDLISFLCPHKCSFKKLSRQICLNIWLMMFVSPTGHRGLISSLATWWPISSYRGWEEGDGWGYNRPLLRHILLSYSGAQ